MKIISLRWLIPLFLIVFILLISLYNLTWVKGQSDQYAESQGLNRMRLRANQLQRTLEHALAKGDERWIEEEIVEAGVDANMRDVYLVDERGRVVSALEKRDIGQPFIEHLQQNHPHFEQGNLRLMEQALKSLQAQFSLVNEGNSIYAVVPIPLPKKQCSLRSYRTGYLVLFYDLKAMKEQAYSALEAQFWQFSGLVGLFTLLFGVGLHFLITARAERLVVAIQAIVNGKEASTQVTGSDELGVLARAIEEMSRQNLEREQALRKSMEGLDQAQAVGKMGSWEWNMATGELKWSKEIYKIFGADPERFEATYEHFLQVIPPEDQALVKERVAAALKGEKPYLVEHRVIRQDTGEVRTVQEQGEVLFNSQTEPQKMLGIVQDITERVEQNQRIRLLAKVFQNASEAIVIINEENKIIETNPAFERISGYTHEEVLGMDPHILSSGRHDTAFYAKMWKSIQDHGQWKGEIWDRRKNGELYPKLLSITRFLDESRQKTYFLGTFTDISQLKNTEYELRLMAYYDALTGLPNRLYFLEQLDQAIKLAKREQQRVALLFVDIDDFKNVNDSLGHAAGDELLKTVSRILRNAVRESDLVSRLGGDEFVLALFKLSEPGYAMQVGEEINRRLSQPIQIRGQEVFINGSIGVSFYPEDGENANELLKMGDTAMYHSKERGKGQVSFYKSHMEANAKIKINRVAELHHALENNEFHVLYQPQVDIESGGITGAEALVRWIHPKEGMISPLEFISIAEESGLIVPLGAWVLNEVCLQTKRWLDAGLNPVPVAVNFSVRQFQRDDVYGLIKKTLAETGLPAHLLRVELTEGILMQEVDKAVDILTDLRHMGVVTSVDDFGTGYSSLSYLNRFPLHELKIDQAFVAHVEEDASIAKAVVSLGLGLNLQVLAEGVETEGQRACLAAMGCLFVQGYFFSKPLKAADMEEVLTVRVLPLKKS